MRLLRTLCLVVLVVGLGACKKEAPVEVPAAPVAAPVAAPAAGEKVAVPAPVTAAFVRFEVQGDEARPVVLFTSTSDKVVDRLVLALRFLSVDDRELGRRPWTQSGPAVVPAQGQAELLLGVAAPTGAAKVEVVPIEVRFVGGETWRGTGVRAAKTGKRPVGFKLNNVEHLRPLSRAEAAVRTAPRPDVRALAPAGTPAPEAPAPEAATPPPITRP